MIKTKDQVVAQMLDEIRADVRLGYVPESVSCFSELHDYVDANEYGGFCDDDFVDAMIAHFGDRDAEEGMPQGFINFMNECQDEVDSVIRSGLL